MITIFFLMVRLSSEILHLLHKILCYFNAFMLWKSPGIWQFFCIQLLAKWVSGGGTGLGTSFLVIFGKIFGHETTNFEQDLENFQKKIVETTSGFNETCKMTVEVSITSKNPKYSRKSTFWMTTYVFQKLDFLSKFGKMIVFLKPCKKMKSLFILLWFWWKIMTLF